MKKIIIIGSFILIALVYFFLHLFWRKYVIFGFDMPWLALSTMDFIKNGTFLTAQNFVMDNTWGFPSWGVAQFFYLGSLLSISQNPVTVSVMLSIINFLGIILIIYLGWDYFSPAVGIVSGLLLASHPWWSIFSMFIYQPSSTMPFVVFAMVFAFLAIRNHGKLWLTLLIISLGILLNLYIETTPFVLVTIMVVLFSKNMLKKNLGFLILGFLVAVVLFTPFIRSYILNPSLFSKSKNAYQTESFEKRLQIVPVNFVKILSGGMFQWQLGYAYKDFTKTIPFSGKAEAVLEIILMAAFMLETIILFVSKDKRIYRLLIILWFTSPLWFLLITPLVIANFAPRYFIIAVPATALILAVASKDVFEWLFGKIKILKHVWLLIPLIISIYWAIFIGTYQNFIKNYDYPNGRLAEADTPYIFIDNAVRWVIFDAERRGYKQIVLSNDLDNPKMFSNWYETKYIWKYVLGKSIEVDENIPIGYYMIQHSSILNEVRPFGYRQFGSFAAYFNP